MDKTLSGWTQPSPRTMMAVKTRNHVVIWRNLFEKQVVERKKYRGILQNLFRECGRFHTARIALANEANDIVGRKEEDLQELHLEVEMHCTAYFTARTGYMVSLRKLSHVSMREALHKAELMRMAGLFDLGPDEVLYYEYHPFGNKKKSVVHLFHGGFGRPDGPGHGHMKMDYMVGENVGVIRFERKPNSAHDDPDE